MFLKMMGAMPGYIYAQDGTGIYVNLFVGSTANILLAGTRVNVQQTTRYPWEGAVRIAVDPQRPAEFDVNVRIPGWCKRVNFMVNDAKITAPPPTKSDTDATDASSTSMVRADSATASAISVGCRRLKSSGTPSRR